MISYRFSWVFALLALYALIIDGRISIPSLSLQLGYTK